MLPHWHKGESEIFLKKRSKLSELQYYTLDYGPTVARLTVPKRVFPVIMLYIIDSLCRLLNSFLFLFDSINFTETI